MSAHTPGPWIDYSERKPDAVGVYEWRIPSVAVPGMVVITCAHMRARGAGYTNTISPVFDHWDGWRVHVPAGLQWRAAPEGIEFPAHRHSALLIEGEADVPCPYCKRVPTWAASWRSGGGTVISSDPHHYNNWWLECCSWSRTPHAPDPRKITTFRNAILAASGAPDLLEMLHAIKRFGELANIGLGESYPPGGKKPGSKDVWAFPRHMLVDLDAAIAKASGQGGAE